MSKKENKQKTPQAEDETVQAPEETVQAQAPETEATQADPGPDPLLAELEALKAQIGDQEDKFLRLAAEYDNFRRRTQKEKEGIYADAKADAVNALLPVYDNLERALKQETSDEAYAKGVEMTMAGLKKSLESLGVEEIPALGESFDPTVHNAVMHVEDEALGENVVAEVFQAGFRLGEKVIRFAMVKVAN